MQARGKQEAHACRHRAQPLIHERSECKPDRAQPLIHERSECKPDRAQPLINERSECKPEASKKLTLAVIGRSH
jgi:hypothetical protein